MINNDLLQYFCCPKCKFDLKYRNGFLVCEKCKKKYEIQEDIPILIDLDNLPKYTREQIKYFEKEDKVRPEYELSEWKKSYIRRLDENFQFKHNEILIDVGTGSGYIAVEMAKRSLNSNCL